MNKLSENQVKNLNAAIDKTMDIIDESGCSPNDAIIKVAKSMKLTQDYIPVLVAAYNNGAQYAQREKGSSILEKTAKFPLADAAAIAAKLYGNEKKASYLYEDNDAFFDLPLSITCPEDKTPAALLHAPVVKAAAYKRESNVQMRRETRINEGVNSVVESIRMEKSAAADAYDDAIKDMADYLQRADAPSLHLATKLASSVYGKSGSVIIKAAASRFSLKDRNNYLEPTVHIDSPFYSHCTKCIEKLAQYNDICDQELGILKDCASMLKPMVSRRVDALYKQSSACDESPAYFFEKKKLELEKQAAPLFNTSGELSADRMASKLPYSDISGLEALIRPQWRDLNPYEHNIMRALDDPEQEAKLRDIAVSANITDLINTDEYLSDQDPEEVIDAYNELMEIAPEIHNKKPLLRAALRQYMESGGIDVQSLGLIGDIGRKTESRVDEARKQLSEQVEKALEYSGKAKGEDRKAVQDMLKFELGQQLTVSEGRKDRMARAEEARKQRSEMRKDREATRKAERERMLLQREDARLQRQAERDLEVLKDSLTKGRDATSAATRARQELIARRAAAKKDFYDKWSNPTTYEYGTDLTGGHKGNVGSTGHTQRETTRGLSRAELNNMLSNLTRFNSMPRGDKRNVYQSLLNMGFGDPTTGKTRFFDPVSFDIIDPTIITRPTQVQVNDDEFDRMADLYAGKVS